MKFYSEESYLQSQGLQEEETTNKEEFGCGFCWDKRRNKSKELFFLDAANNMRVCAFCPSCGRKYEV